MSKLTTPIRIDIPGVGSIESADLYLKSEADKVIARNKYKRCLAMAMWCESVLSVYPWYGEISHEERRWQKWQQRWLAIADKFKEAK